MQFARDIWFLLTPGQKRASVGLLGWMLLSMLFEMLGIGLMLPALTAMAGSAPAANSQFFAPLLKFLGNPAPHQLIMGGLLSLLVVYALKAVFVLIANWRQTRFIRRLEKTLCERLFSAYLNQSWDFHLSRNSSELIRNMVNVGFFADASALLLSILAELFILVGIAAMLVFIDPVATLVIGSFAAVSTWVLDRLTKKRSMRWGGIKQTHQALALRAVQEGLGGIKDAKVLGREPYFLDEYSRHAAVLAAMAERNTVISVVPRLWHEMLGVSSLCLLALILLWQGMPPSALVPTLGVFGAAAFRMLPSVNRVSMAMQSVRYASELTSTIIKEIQLERPLAPSRASLPMPLLDSIELVGVKYRYKGSAADALHAVSIRIPFGSSVGIIGSSGAGKSTLVDVLLGLLQPTAGQVLVDGSDIAKDISGWQARIGYVPQSIYLCDDTVRGNVAFGVPRDKIDDSAVDRAIRAAQLDEFIASLPEGLDTVVGERGVRLSGGQRQRIGIARALYCDPKVLVLDEATSALDTVTEKGVMEAVEKLHGSKTLVIIAHRLSTVAICDKLYRLESGRVEASGTYAELIG